ncbi:uncharacterized protein [Acropora muricata]|uniref:uncharacterized protein n=1 Tax=Acropora muricata TaxID=159855 RepID=UPI0034E5E413
MEQLEVVPVTTEKCYLCSKEVAYGHKCFTCKEVICTFPSCSTAHEENDLASPVYFCQNCKKDEKPSCSAPVTTEKCYLCSKEVAYGHKCFTCKEVICTFPSCSTAHEENDLASPVYFCQNCKKDEKPSCSGATISHDVHCGNMTRGICSIDSHSCFILKY